MDCFRCGDHADYDRITIRRSSGTVEGSLCMDCEARWLTEQSTSAELSMATCFECGGESKLLFPRWDSIVESEDGTGSVDTEYRIRLTTPGSCQQCLERVRSSP